MKIWKAAVAVVLFAGLAIIPLGCDEEDTSTTDSGGGGLSIAGNWQLITSWRGGTVNAVAGVVTLEGGESGTFTLSSGYAGTWNCAGYFGSLFFMQIATAEHAQYSGRLVDSTRIEGTMRNNQNQSGTFYMTKL